MALFFSITLLVAILGMVSLVAVKRWEIKTGSVVFGGVRPAVGRVCATTLLWVERIIPALVRIYGRRAWRTALASAHRAIAHAVLYAERLLERTLVYIRHVTSSAPRRSGEVSAFLREVGEHKKRLLKSSQVRVRKVVQE